MDTPAKRLEPNHFTEFKMLINFSKPAAAFRPSFFLLIVSLLLPVACRAFAIDGPQFESRTGRFNSEVNSGRWLSHDEGSNANLAPRPHRLLRAVLGRASLENRLSDGILGERSRRDVIGRAMVEGEIQQQQQRQYIEQERLQRQQQQQGNKLLMQPTNEKQQLQHQALSVQQLQQKRNEQQQQQQPLQHKILSGQQQQQQLDRNDGLSNGLEKITAGNSKNQMLSDEDFNLQSVTIAPTENSDQKNTKSTVSNKKFSGLRPEQNMTSSKIENSSEGLQEIFEESPEEDIEIKSARFVAKAGEKIAEQSVAQEKTVEKSKEKSPEKLALKTANFETKLEEALREKSTGSLIQHNPSCSKSEVKIRAKRAADLGPDDILRLARMDQLMDGGSSEVAAQQQVTDFTDISNPDSRLDNNALAKKLREAIRTGRIYFKKVGQPKESSSKSGSVGLNEAGNSKRVKSGAPTGSRTAITGQIFDLIGGRFAAAVRNYGKFVNLEKDDAASRGTGGGDYLIERNIPDYSSQPTSAQKGNAAEERKREYPYLQPEEINEMKRMPLRAWGSRIDSSRVPGGKRGCSVSDEADCRPRRVYKTDNGVDPMLLMVGIGK